MNRVARQPVHPVTGSHRILRRGEGLSVVAMSRWPTRCDFCWECPLSSIPLVPLDNPLGLEPGLDRRTRLYPPSPHVCCARLSPPSSREVCARDQAQASMREIEPLGVDQAGMEVEGSE